MSDTTYCTGCGYHAALLADHIEELEAENKRLRLEVAHANDTADAAIERTKELEDKLAKAIEALEKLARLGSGQYYGNSDGNMIARTALAELKGETDG